MRASIKGGVYRKQILSRAGRHLAPLVIHEERGMKRIWVAVGLGAIVGGVLTGAAVAPVDGAQVARGVTRVNVVNFPASEAVTGQVGVSNLPLDPNGNLRVAEQATASPSSATVEARFHESDRDPATGLFPVFPIPQGFAIVSVAVQSLDRTTWVVGDFEVHFGSENAPTTFPKSTPLSPKATQDVRAEYRVGGTRMQIGLGAINVGGPCCVVPPETEYYVHLYFAR